MAKCRSCGATIKFIKTPRGKFMPVDPELYSADDCEPGDVLVSEDGEVHHITEVYVISGEGCRPIEGYISHFATCPDAQQWRKQ